MLRRTSPVWHVSRFPLASTPGPTRVVVSSVTEVDARVRCEGISLKYVRTGEEVYTTGRDVRVVRPGHFLLVNDGQEYHVGFRSDAAVEGLCVYLAPRLVMDACRDLAAALDGPPPDDTPGFHSLLYSAHLSGVGRQLALLDRTLRNPTFRHEDWDADAFYVSLTQTLLNEQAGVRAAMDAIDAKRPGTRAELYQRVGIAATVIHDRYEEPISLRTLSREAGLSKFHLLRTFKQVLGETPYRYQARVRIDHAKALLADTDLAIGTIAHAVGYADLPTFSKAFRRVEAIPPSGYRSRVTAS
ncbi:MAG: AraC family transcriptional regulator [Bacteroidota bacterium]